MTCCKRLIVTPLSVFTFCVLTFIQHLNERLSKSLQIKSVAVDKVQPSFLKQLRFLSGHRNSEFISEKCLESMFQFFGEELKKKKC